MKCLVSFLCIKNPVESAPELPDIATLSVQDDDACNGNGEGQEEGIHEEDDQDCESNDDLHAENFKVNITNRHYWSVIMPKGKIKLLLHMLSSNRTISRTKTNSRFILTMNGISLVTVMWGKFQN